MLSEAKKLEIVNKHFYPGMQPEARHYLDFALAIEAAVLAELAKQEPVAWITQEPDGDGGYHRDIVYGKERPDFGTIPLYLHPSPFALKDSLIEQAFHLVYEASSRPADTFNDHADWAIWQHGKVIKAFGLLQRVTGRASWAEDNCPAPAPEGMVLVPREPTFAMLAALFGKWVPTEQEPTRYASMIAAAEKESGKCLN